MAATGLARDRNHDLKQLRTTAASTEYDVQFDKIFFRDVVETIAHENSYDPVLERIAAAEAAWDGIPRLNTFLHYALGVPADPYHTAVGRNVMGGIVKRARKPGCKHDELMVLIGPEDTLKSSFCRKLGLSDDWFSDSIKNEGSDQNLIPQLFGHLVIELAELDEQTRR